MFVLGEKESFFFFGVIGYFWVGVYFVRWSSFGFILGSYGGF